MDRDLNHDEHQFLAPGALLSREGLLPYRDYPLFHVPNLVFIYGALDRLTGELLVSAKLVSVVSTCGVAILLCLVALARTSASHASGRWGVVIAVLALFLFDPLTVESTGKTWNHEFPTFLTIAALLLHTQAARRDSLLWMAASGALLGLAIGSRLTFAPLGFPFAFFPLLFALPWRRRLAHCASFCIAGVIASAPSLYFLGVDREAFLFGNLEFPRLRLLDPENTRIRKTMSWWRKLRYFAKEIMLPSWPLFVAYAALGARPAIAWFRTRRAETMAAALLLCALPFALLGCFAPSRYQYQHYYLFAPLLVLGTLLGATADRGNATRDRKARGGLMLLAAATFVSLVGQCWRADGVAAFDWLGRIGHPDQWFPAKERAIGLSIRAQVPAGKVLTLAPTAVLEGGLKIYPEFATGPFAWRSARFAAPESRQRLKLVAPDDLEVLLERDPPAAILTGVEDDDLEEPFVAYARAHGFEPRKLAKRRVLWLPPTP